MVTKDLDYVARCLHISNIRTQHYNGWLWWHSDLFVLRWNPEEFKLMHQLYRVIKESAKLPTYVYSSRR